MFLFYFCEEKVLSVTNVILVLLKLSAYSADNQYCQFLTFLLYSRKSVEGSSKTEQQVFFKAFSVTENLHVLAPVKF